MGQSVTVTVGPLADAAGDADAAALSQAAAGAQYLVLNGVKSSFDADAIAQAQQPGSASDLTLNGALVSGGVAYIGSEPGATAARRVYITSAGDDSGITFTVYGTIHALGGPVSVVETVTGADTGVVSTAAVFDTVTRVTASGAAAGNVSVGVHGPATFDAARRVTITSGGSDTGITFTIYGTDHAGNPQSETVTGASSTAASSVLDYKTVTGVRASGATASTVQVGINGVAASPWVRFDDFADGEISIQCTVSGTVNYSLQQTMEDPNRVTNNVPPNTTEWSKSGITWVNHPDDDLVSATSSAQGNYTHPPAFARILLNSSTNPGFVTATFRQMA